MQKKLVQHGNRPLDGWVLKRLAMLAASLELERAAPQE